MSALLSYHCFHKKNLWPHRVPFGAHERRKKNPELGSRMGRMGTLCEPRMDGGYVQSHLGVVLKDSRGGKSSQWWARPSVDLLVYFRWEDKWPKDKNKYGFMSSGKCLGWLITCLKVVSLEDQGQESLGKGMWVDYRSDCAAWRSLCRILTSAREHPP